MYTRYMKAYVYLWTMSPWGAIFRLTEANQSTSCYNTFTLTWRTASSFLFFHPLTCYHCPPIFLTTIEIVLESLSQLFIRPSLHSLMVLESCLNMLGKLEWTKWREVLLVLFSTLNIRHFFCMYIRRENPNAMTYRYELQYNPCLVKNTFV